MTLKQTTEAINNEQLQALQLSSNGKLSSKSNKANPFHKGGDCSKRNEAKKGALNRNGYNNANNKDDGCSSSSQPSSLLTVVGKDNSPNSEPFAERKEAEEEDQPKRSSSSSSRRRRRRRRRSVEEGFARMEKKAKESNTRGSAGGGSDLAEPEAHSLEPSSSSSLNCWPPEIGSGLQAGKRNDVDRKEEGNENKMEISKMKKANRRSGSDECNSDVEADSESALEPRKLARTDGYTTNVGYQAAAAAAAIGDGCCWRDQQGGGRLPLLAAKLDASQQQQQQPQPIQIPIPGLLAGSCSSTKRSTNTSASTEAHGNGIGQAAEAEALIVATTTTKVDSIGNSGSVSGGISIILCSTTQSSSSSSAATSTTNSCSGVIGSSNTEAKGEFESGATVATTAEAAAAAALPVSIRGETEKQQRQQHRHNNNNNNNNETQQQASEVSSSVSHNSNNLAKVEGRQQQTTEPSPVEKQKQKEQQHKRQQRKQQNKQKQPATEQEEEEGEEEEEEKEKEEGEKKEKEVALIGIETYKFVQQQQQEIVLDNNNRHRINPKEQVEKKSNYCNNTICKHSLLSKEQEQESCLENSSNLRQTNNNSISHLNNSDEIVDIYNEQPSPDQAIVVNLSKQNNNNSTKREHQFESELSSIRTKTKSRALIQYSTANAFPANEIFSVPWTTAPTTTTTTTLSNQQQTIKINNSQQQKAVAEKSITNQLKHQQTLLNHHHTTTTINYIAPTITTTRTAPLQQSPPPPPPTTTTSSSVVFGQQYQQQISGGQQIIPSLFAEASSSKPAYPMVMHNFGLNSQEQQQQNNSNNNNSNTNTKTKSDLPWQNNNLANLQQQLQQHFNATTGADGNSSAAAATAAAVAQMQLQNYGSYNNSQQQKPNSTSSSSSSSTASLPTTPQTQQSMIDQIIRTTLQESNHMPKINNNNNMPAPSSSMIFNSNVNLSTSQPSQNINNNNFNSSTSGLMSTPSPLNPYYSSAISTADSLNNNIIMNSNNITNDNSNLPKNLANSASQSALAAAVALQSLNQAHIQRSRAQQQQLQLQTTARPPSNSLPSPSLHGSNNNMPKLGIISTTSSNHQNHNHLTLLNQQQQIDNFSNRLQQQQQQQQKIPFCSKPPINWQDQAAAANTPTSNPNGGPRWSSQNPPYSPSPNFNVPPYSAANLMPSGIVNNLSNNNNMIGNDGDNNTSSRQKNISINEQRQSNLTPNQFNTNIRSGSNIDFKSIGVNPNNIMKQSYQWSDNNNPKGLLSNSDNRIKQSQDVLMEELQAIKFMREFISIEIPGTPKLKKQIIINDDIRQSINRRELYTKQEELVISVLTNQCILINFDLIEYLKYDKFSIQELERQDFVHKRLGLQDILSYIITKPSLPRSNNNLIDCYGLLQANNDILSRPPNSDNIFNNQAIYQQQQSALNQQQIQSLKNAPFLPPYPGKQQADLSHLEKNRRLSQSPSDIMFQRSQLTSGPNGGGPRVSSINTSSSPNISNSSFNNSNLMNMNNQQFNSTNLMNQRGLPPPQPAQSHSRSSPFQQPGLQNSYTGGLPPRANSTIGMIQEPPMCFNNSPAPRQPPAAHQSSTARSSLAGGANLSLKAPVSAHMSSATPQTPRSLVHSNITPPPISKPNDSYSPGRMVTTAGIISDPKFGYSNTNQFNPQSKIDVDSVAGLPVQTLLSLKQQELINKDLGLKNVNVPVTSSNICLQSNFAHQTGIRSPIGQQDSHLNMRSPMGAHQMPSIYNPYPPNLNNSAMMNKLQSSSNIPNLSGYQSMPPPSSNEFQKNSIIQGESIRFNDPPSSIISPNVTNETQLKQYSAMINAYQQQQQQNFIMNKSGNINLGPNSSTTSLPLGININTNPYGNPNQSINEGIFLDIQNNPSVYSQVQQMSPKQNNQRSIITGSASSSAPKRSKKSTKNSPTSNNNVNNNNANSISNENQNTVTNNLETISHDVASTNKTDDGQLDKVGLLTPAAIVSLLPDNNAAGQADAINATHSALPTFDKTCEAEIINNSTTDEAKTTSTESALINSSLANVDNNIDHNSSNIKSLNPHRESTENTTISEKLIQPQITNKETPPSTTNETSKYQKLFTKKAWLKNYDQEDHSKINNNDTEKIQTMTEVKKEDTLINNNSNNTNNNLIRSTEATSPSPKPTQKSSDKQVRKMPSRKVKPSSDKDDQRSPVNSPKNVKDSAKKRGKKDKLPLDETNSKRKLNASFDNVEEEKNDEDDDDANSKKSKKVKLEQGKKVSVKNNVDDDKTTRRQTTGKKGTVSAIRKKNGEKFLQTDPCYDIVPKNIRCLECRRVRQSSQKNDKVVTAKQSKTNWDDFCRFYEFRKLRYNKASQIVVAGFSDLDDADESDMVLWSPHTDVIPENLSLDVAKFILKNVGDDFCNLVMQERAAIDSYDTEKDNDNKITWKRAVNGLRELCDVCSTTLFNCHYVCERCGFVVCIDCYQSRSKQSVDSSPICHSVSLKKEQDDEESDKSSATSTKNNNSDSNENGQSETPEQPTTPASKKNKRDSFGWIYCAKNEEHSHEKMILTQIIAGDCLEEVWKLLHQTRAKLKLGQCSCKQSSLSPKKEQSNAYEDLKTIKMDIGEVIESDQKQTVNKPKTTDSDDESENPHSTLKELLLASTSCNNGSTKLLDDVDDDSQEDTKLSQQVTAAIEGCISSLPNGTMDSPVSNNTNNSQGDSDETLVEFKEDQALQHQQKVIDQPETHTWLCDDDLLVLSQANHKMNVELFRKNWTQGKPVLVRGVDKLMEIDMWLPQFFGKQFGDYRSDLVDCRNGDIHRHSMKKYWEGFEPSNGATTKKKVNKDDSMTIQVPAANNEELSNGPCYYVGSALWRLKDWPPGQDFYEILPNHYDDFMNNLPLKEYTTRSGELNLACRLPKEMLKPDLGPKMYSAYGTSKFPERGTTNLHLDISDAINVMVYVSGATSFSNGSEEISDNYIKTVDECHIDAKMKEQIKSKNLVPGALWHIFRPCDVQKMRDFLNKVSDERNISPEKRTDPIHDQTWYLDQTLLDRLEREHGVKSYPILQCMGDAILIPAGSPHQVKNLQNCIKVANDFVSPENVTFCLKLTNEFRSLPETHINQEDKLQIKNIIYHSVKESLQYIKLSEWKEA